VFEKGRIMKSPVLPVLFLGLFVSGTAPSPTPQTAKNPVRIPDPLTAGGDLREFLNHMEIVQVPDGLGGTVKTISFHGVNVRIVNGTGTTDGVVDGAGNLIVGYNELRTSGNFRSGSHNLVVGKEHNFSSFGGLVAGKGSTVSGAHASVSGGRDNTASGFGSSVSGGTNRSALGDDDWVAGTLFEDN
jgi:hypothetical protein